MLCDLSGYAAIPKADASVCSFKSRFHLRDMSIAKACAKGVLPVPAAQSASMQLHNENTIICKTQCSHGLLHCIRVWAVMVELCGDPNCFAVASPLRVLNCGRRPPDNLILDLARHTCSHPRTRSRSAF